MLFTAKRAKHFPLISNKQRGTGTSRPHLKQVFSHHSPTSFKPHGHCFMEILPSWVQSKQPFWSSLKQAIAEGKHATNWHISRDRWVVGLVRAGSFSEAMLQATKNINIVKPVVNNRKLMLPFHRETPAPSVTGTDAAVQLLLTHGEEVQLERITKKARNENSQLFLFGHITLEYPLSFTQDLNTRMQKC